QCPHYDLLAIARQRQRAPGRAQADADRRFVRPVAADVADDDVQAAVARLQQVEEVAAEQRAAAPGAIARGDPCRRALDLRSWRETFFKARRLASLGLREQQLALGLLRAAAADCV